jgi:hypothetical protein
MSVKLVLISVPSFQHYKCKQTIKHNETVPQNQIEEGRREQENSPVNSHETQKTVPTLQLVDETVERRVTLTKRPSQHAERHSSIGRIAIYWPLIRPALPQTTKCRMHDLPKNFNFDFRFPLPRQIADCQCLVDSRNTGKIRYKVKDRLVSENEHATTSTTP